MIDFPNIDSKAGKFGVIPGGIVRVNPVVSGITVRPVGRSIHSKIVTGPLRELVQLMSGSRLECRQRRTVSSSIRGDVDVARHTILFDWAESKWITEVDRIAAGVRVEVDPARQANRILRQETPDGGAIVPALVSNLNRIWLLEHSTSLP